MALPRWSTPRTPDRLTYGPAVARIGAALGWPFMPWQRLAADVTGEIDPQTGDLAYSIVVVTVQRQAGKTTLIGPTGLQRAAAAPDAGVWITAQTRGDARDTWMDIAKRTQRSDLSGLTFRFGNGSEQMSLPNGSAFRVFAPQVDALHGKANRLVVIDEAWTIPEVTGIALEQAVLPTFNTVPGQLWIVSAAGDGSSRWFRRWVDAGRSAVEAGKRTGLCYLEYGIPDDADATDVDVIMEHHPAAGHTLRRAAVELAADKMTPTDFARAYGNRWPVTVSRVVSAVVWADSTTADVLPPGSPLVFGADVAHDRSAASIVACAAGVLELVQRRDGVAWLAPRLRELEDRHAPIATVLDAFGPAATVVDELTRDPLRTLLVPSTREYAAGCAALVDDLVTLRRRHRESADLDAALAAATTRTYGDMWLWARGKSSGPIDALIAASLASWGLDHGPPEQVPAPRPLVYAG